MGEWISVEDRLPAEGDQVMGSDGKGISRLQYGGRHPWGGEIEGWWHWAHISGTPVFSYKITHWQPLLEPPKSE